MKKLICVLLFSIIGLTGNLLEAQTNVSGIITTNTAWTVTGSPYIVIGNTLLDSGYTLTIEPGVIVKFNSGLSIQIDGTLIAQGTSDHKITFTSNTADTAGAWGYIYFSSASTDAVFENNIYGNYLSGSILEHCIIQYSGGSSVTNNGALRFDDAHPFVNYCTISDNKSTGITAYNLTGSLKISNSTIKNNKTISAGGGINIGVGYGGNILIYGNTISNNTATDNYGGGICNMYNIYGNITISNNTIIENTASTGGGISGGYSITIINNIIMGNSATYAGGGISLGYGYATIIFGNAIINNSSYIAGGIINGEGGSNMSVSNNIIADNFSSGSNGGIYNYNSSLAILNNHILRNTAADNSGLSLSGYVGITLHQNTIADNKNTDYNNNLNRGIFIEGVISLDNNNIFNNSAFYELYNGNPQGSQNVPANNNWWGTSNDADVQSKIYDWIDNNSLGVVDFNPFLTAPDTLAPLSPPANVIKTNLGNGTIQLSWVASPEFDVAGYHVYYGGFNGFSFTHSVDVGNNISYISSALSLTDVIAVTAYDNMYSPANENDSTIVNENMINGNESWFTFAIDTSAVSNIALDDNGMPIGYSLVQNYPNPFNSTSVIKYSIPNSSQVTLKIFNSLGEELETLVNEVKGTGIYEIDWNAVNLPSGVYFYRLQAGGFIAAKKMILLK